MKVVNAKQDCGVLPSEWEMQQCAVWKGDHEMGWQPLGEKDLERQEIVATG